MKPRRLVGMRTISIVTIVAMTSLAYADAQIAIGPPSNPRVKLDERVEVHAAGDASLVKLQLGLVSTSGQLPVARIAISLPTNARVVGMVLSQANQAFTAESMTARDARGELDVHKAWVDPALLEWRGETADSRRLALTIAPITTTPSTVTVLVAIPHLQSLDLDVAGSRRTIPRAAFGRATADERLMATRHDFVTREESLYAGPTDPRADGGVESYARASYYDLRMCYGGSQRRDIALHFTIQNGRVHEPFVEGTSAQTAGCVAGVLERWTFREFGSPVRIDYPLQIVPLDALADGSP